jgi:hypothetical protein
MSSKKNTYPLTKEQKAVILFNQRKRRADRKKEKETTGTIAKVDKRTKAFRTGGYPRIHIAHPDIVLHPIPRKKMKKKPTPKRTPKAAKPIVVKVAIAEKRLPQSPKVTALKKDRKPKLQSDRMIIPVTPPMQQYTFIPELRMSVYLQEGQSIADVVAKYKNRVGAKIPKW